jgi:hypothetical protein
MPFNTIDVTSTGAVGKELPGIRGSITAGTNILTVNDATGFRVGGGVGVEDAANNRRGQAVALRAAVLALSGNQLTLDSAADNTVSGAVITVDDSIPIQAAIDTLGAVGGVVLLPAGTYIVGVPHAWTNVPLFVPSNVTLRGAGRDVTTLKTCDHAMQFPAAVDSYHPGLTHDSESLPTAGLIVNRSNLWWHQNQPWTNQDATDDPFLTPDRYLAIEEMTLDGNNGNQPYTFVPGNRTAGAVPDVRPYPFLYSTSVPNADEPSPPPTPSPPISVPVQPGDVYYAAVTWADAQGNETAAQQTYVTIGPGDNAFVIVMPTPPPGAVAQNVYIANRAVDPIDNISWQYPYAGQATSHLWERVTLGRVLPGGTKYTVAIHNVPDGSSAVYPPGSGLFQPSSSNASAHHAVYVDNCSYVRLHKLKIVNTCSDGIEFGANIESVINNVPRHAVTDVWIDDVDIHGTGRYGIGMVGEAHRVNFERVNVLSTTGIGCVDIEPNPSVLSPCSGITFRDCRFVGGWTSDNSGIQIFARENAPMTDIVIVGCEFDDNWAHLSFNNELIETIVRDCRFQNAANIAITTNALGTGTVDGCHFEFNGRLHPPPPDNFTGENVIGVFQCNQILSGTPPCWRFSNNRVIVEPIPGSSTMVLYGGAGIVCGNEFRVVPRRGSPPVNYRSVAYGTTDAAVLLQLPSTNAGPFFSFYENKGFFVVV